MACGPRAALGSFKPSPNIRAGQARENRLRASSGERYVVFFPQDKIAYETCRATIRV
jgi:hypothetical protein